MTATVKEVSSKKNKQLLVKNIYKFNLNLKHSHLRSSLIIFPIPKYGRAFYTQVVCFPLQIRIKTNTPELNVPSSFSPGTLSYLIRNLVLSQTKPKHTYLFFSLTFGELFCQVVVHQLLLPRLFGFVGQKIWKTESFRKTLEMT